MYLRFSLRYRNLLLIHMFEEYTLVRRFRIEETDESRVTKLQTIGQRTRYTKTARNLRARINFNRVINAAHRLGKIWIVHAAPENRAKNNISVRLL